MMQKEQNTPQYIKQLPWYAQDSKGGGELIKIPTHDPKGFIEDWYNRGQKGVQASNYRKGACENCGAMGHNRKQCTERPRKTGAKFTNKSIASDDLVKEIKMNWQVKRDRWNGYSPDMYKEVIEDYKNYEDVRKKVKGEEADQMLVSPDPLKAATLPSANKKEKFQGLGGVRNREDRAKYLLNLDVNSANFDPKSRTLQGEDEFLKELSNLQAVGEKSSLEQQDRFAFEQVQKNHSQLNSTALPTLTQKIFKNVQQKQAGLNSGKMGQIIRKYGAQSSIGANTLNVIVEQNEGAENYSRIRKITRSKYDQDIFVNDHSAVWGSWYNKYLGWGYSCCHSNDKQSYCMGIKGKEKALGRELKAKANMIKQMEKMRQLQQDVADKQDQQDRDNKQPVDQ